MKQLLKTIKLDNDRIIKVYRDHNNTNYIIETTHQGLTNYFTKESQEEAYQLADDVAYAWSNHDIPIQYWAIVYSSSNGIGVIAPFTSEADAEYYYGVHRDDFKDSIVVNIVCTENPIPTKLN